jgi:hypothetical protein
MPVQVDSLPATTRQVAECGQRLFENYETDNIAKLIRCIIATYDEFDSRGKARTRSPG